ncbi:MAG: IS481 family transposase [Polyangiaceae bacterium]|nr:IS481 family transposase [Polyangiaceae bacterium]
MPWKEQRVVDQREVFVRTYLRGIVPMAELCREHGITRKTGYKWVQRYHEGGMPNLMDRSRAPHSRSNAVAEEVVEAIVALRKKRPTWGARKLLAVLERKDAKVSWPAASTVAEILSRHGLVMPRKRRQRTPLSTQPLAAAREPNDIWCADYKGKFRLDRRYCHPFTITDAASRYVLCCFDTGTESTEPTKAACERAFREYGLPRRIRSDNGSPFATRGVGGLSALSVWWVKLGILPERIEPGKPQQNGRHERMHRTLKNEAVVTGSRADAQQAAFDRWRDDFNRERPHEAIGNRPPAEVYRPSPRRFPDEVGDPEYPEDFEVRRVRANGRARCASLDFSLGTVLRNEAVGIEPIDDGRFQLWFGPIYLGLLTDLGRGEYTLDKNIPKQ